MKVLCAARRYIIVLYDYESNAMTFAHKKPSLVKKIIELISQSKAHVVHFLALNQKFTKLLDEFEKREKVIIKSIAEVRDASEIDMGDKSEEAYLDINELMGASEKLSATLDDMQKDRDHMKSIKHKLEMLPEHTSEDKSQVSKMENITALKELYLQIASSVEKKEILKTEWEEFSATFSKLPKIENFLSMSLDDALRQYKRIAENIILEIEMKARAIYKKSEELLDLRENLIEDYANTLDDVMFDKEEEAIEFNTQVLVDPDTSKHRFHKPKKLHQAVSSTKIFTPSPTETTRVDDTLRSSRDHQKTSSMKSRR